MTLGKFIYFVCQSLGQDDSVIHFARSKFQYLFPITFHKSKEEKKSRTWKKKADKSVMFVDNND